MVEVAKEVVTTVKKVAKAVSDSFTIEIGTGFGLGSGANVGGAGAELVAKKTFNWGYSNGKNYTSTTTALSATIGSSNNNNFNVGISYEINHYDHGDIEHDNVMVMPWTIRDCKYTSKDISVTAIYKEKTSASFEEDTTFIGLDIDAFLGVGVHLKLGFSI